MRFYLHKILLLLTFIFFPSLVRIKEKNYRLKGISIKEKGKGKPLVISFAGLGTQFNFENSLEQFDANVIYLRDVQHQWYLKGVEGIGGDVEHVKKFLDSEISRLQSGRVLVLGVSAGGFAAILYGNLLNVNSIFTFSPQTFMNRWNCIRYLDYRWLDRVVQIYAKIGSDKKYLDLKPLVKYSEIPMTLVYDGKHRLDRIHGKRLKGNNITHLIESGGGHSLVQKIRDEGALMKMLEQWFEET